MSGRAHTLQPADLTGLLPVWNRFVDKTVVDQYGFTYDPAEAKKLLANAGYRDVNGDGMVETPDGRRIALTMMTPAGWTDWNAAAEVIAAGAKAVGINLTAQTPDAGAVDDARTSGNFDLLMNNWTNLDASPWQLDNYLFQLPVQPNQPTNNFARYVNQEAWTLTQQVGRMSVQDPAIQQPLPAAADHADRDAGDSNVVQRPLVAGEQRHLDQLAVGLRRPPALLPVPVGRLDREGRRVHAGPHQTRQVIPTCRSPVPPPAGRPSPQGPAS